MYQIGHSNLIGVLLCYIVRTKKLLPDCYILTGKDENQDSDNEYHCHAQILQC